MNSFFPNGVASWKIIIKRFVTMPSISKLKEHMLSLFRPNIKSMFNIYDPIGLRYIFQLRLIRGWNYKSLSHSMLDLYTPKPYQAGFIYH